MLDNKLCLQSLQWSGSLNPCKRVKLDSWENSCLALQIAPTELLAEVLAEMQQTNLACICSLHDLY